MPPIPDTVIEELKYKNNIEDIVSGYVSLRRAGSNLNGLCPFHSERTPSFTVFPSNGSFYCFGCGAGGDVITFVMKMQNLDYREALDYLADRAGIRLPDSGLYRTGTVNRERYFNMNRDAAKFFYSELQKSETAREYLKKRELPESLCRHFGMGWAPNDFQALTDYMLKLGYSEDELTSGFLCGRSKKTDKLYDLFRGRIMIPIIDNTGEIIAFGGRIVDSTDDRSPKYLNSSDTPVFKKSKNLFALNFARQSCGENMILCEGYMDVIALHGAGITNAIATLGTAITSEQARIMARYTKRVYISYDSDEAGQRASDKAFRLLGEVGLDTKIIQMNGAKDPDEYIKKFGAARFRKLLETSKSEFDFKLDLIIGRYDINDDNERIKAAQDVCVELANPKQYSAVEREVYVMRAAEKLKMPSDPMRHDIERLYKSKQRSAVTDESRKLILQSQGVGDRVNPDYMKNVRAARAEEAILGMMLLFPEHLSAVSRDAELLCEDDFITVFGKRVFTEIMKRYDGVAFDYGRLAEELSPDEMGRVQRMILRRGELSDNGDKVFLECIKVLRTEKKKANRNSPHNSIQSDLQSDSESVKNGTKRISQFKRTENYYTNMASETKWNEMQAKKMQENGQGTEDGSVVKQRPPRPPASLFTAAESGEKTSTDKTNGKSPENASLPDRNESNDISDIMSIISEKQDKEREKLKNLKKN